MMTVAKLSRRAVVSSSANQKRCVWWTLDRILKRQTVRGENSTQDHHVESLSSQLLASTENHQS